MSMMYKTHMPPHHPSSETAIAEPHYIEGVFRLDFEPEMQVCRFECSDFYAHRAQNFCTSCKEMDFILYRPRKRELWLVELKDYRFNARPRIQDLVEKLCRKVRDSLFVLKIAATCAPEEQPDEGISLRQMGRLSQQALRIRLAFGIEQMGDAGMQASILMGVKDMLLRQLKFIDPELLCVSIRQSPQFAPWRVSPARGELSSKLQKRLQQARALPDELPAPQKTLPSASKAQQTQARGSKSKRRAAHSALPRWKQRAIERANGYSGTHQDRRQFLDHIEGAE